MLKYKIFETPNMLCDWINDNCKLITVVSICSESEKFVLFYIESVDRRLYFEKD